MQENKSSLHGRGCTEERYLPQETKIWLLPQIHFPKVKNNTGEELVEPAPETSGFWNLELKIDSFGPCSVKTVERLDLFEREIKKT